MGRDPWPSSNALHSITSVFDTMTSLWHERKDYRGTDPGTATCISRRVILLMWEGYMRLREEEYRQLSSRIHFRETRDDSKHREADWGADVLRRLKTDKMTNEMITSDILNNIKALSFASHDHHFIEQSEVENWRALHADAMAFGQKLNSLIDAYMQEATIEEIRTCSQQAHHLSLLTSTSIILLVISVTASTVPMASF